MTKTLLLALCFGVSLGVGYAFQVPMAEAAARPGKCPFCAGEWCRRGPEGAYYSGISTGGGCSEWGLCFSN